MDLDGFLGYSGIRGGDTLLVFCFLGPATFHRLQDAAQKTF